MASEREAARDAVIAAIRELFAPAPVSWSGWVAGKFLRGYDADLADKVKAALTLLDALQAEPPESAEPALPPRGVAEQCGSQYASCIVVKEGNEAHCQACGKRWQLPTMPANEAQWREMMARVDHEGGC